MTPHNIAANRLGLWGAGITLPGIVLSSPVAVVLIHRIAPQPPWQDARVFAAHFHPLQTVTFFAGFLLVGGYVAALSAVHLAADERHHPRTFVAAAFTTVFAALIFFNYIVQTTFVPALVRDGNSVYDPIIGALTMSNPIALSWAIEMWGYGVLGVATWLAASAFDRSPVERRLGQLMRLNGVTSVLGALATAIDARWVLTTPGLWSYALWNVLIVAISILMWWVFKARLASADRVNVAHTEGT